MPLPSSSSRAPRPPSARIARPGPRAHLLTAAALLLSFASPFGSLSASASPIDDPHVGGIGFSGPTSDDLSALYWNPAALGLGVGRRITVAATGHLGSITGSRAPIDPVTGQPGGSRVFPSVRGRTDLLPRSFPLGPGGFLALASNIGHRVTFAGGVYTPFAQRSEFPAANDGSQPLRYQAVSTEMSTVALSPAISVLLGAGVRVGLAPAFLLTRGRIVVDRDTGSPSGSTGAARMCGATPCGAEHEAAAARYVIESDTGFFDRAFSFTLAVGVHLNRPLWSVGLSFTSKPLGTRDGIEWEGRQSRIELPERLRASTTLCPTALDPCVSTRVVLRLPTQLTVGVERHLTPRWDVALIVRWLDLSIHDQIAIRAIGPAGGSLRNAGLPEELLLHRGMQDVLDVRLRSLFRLGDRIDIAISLRGETASVPDEAVTAAAPGGRVIEPSLALRLRVSPLITLSAGYALTFMPTVNANPSVFDPGAAATCEAAGGDLDSEACQRRQRGQAGPSAAGRYGALTHGFGLSTALIW